MQDIDNCLRIPTAGYSARIVRSREIQKNTGLSQHLTCEAAFAKVSLIIFDDYGAEEGVRALAQLVDLLQAES